MECASSDCAAAGATSGAGGSGRLISWGASGATFACIVGEWLAAHTAQRCASRLPLEWKCRASATEAMSSTATQHHAASRTSIRKRRFWASSSTASD